MKIVLEGNPRSTQNCYKMTCRGKFATLYMDKACKDIKSSYEEQAKKQWKRKPMEGNLDINIRLYFKTKGKADWDNFHKLSMDSLSGIVWKDDSQIQSANVQKGYDKDYPRIEIEVYE